MGNSPEGCLVQMSVQNKTLSNWASTHTCTPKDVFYPENISQVQDVVRLCQSDHRKLRVMGAGHSPNAIAMSNDIVMSLDKMDKLFSVSSAAAEEEEVNGSGRGIGIAHFEAGIRLREAHVVLQKEGYCFSNVGSISEQSLAGVICTAAHGTGMTFGSICSTVREILFVNANAEVVRCSGQENPNIFKAILCGLGCIGIIVEVKVEVSSLFKLLSHQRLVTWEGLWEVCEQKMREHRHFRWWWFPLTTHVVEWHADAVEWGKEATELEAIESELQGGIKIKIEEASVVVQGAEATSIAMGPLLEKMLLEGLHNAEVVRAINESYATVCFAAPQLRLGHPAHILNFNCLFAQFVDEWAIPYRHTQAAMTALRQWIADHNYPAHFPIEVRFTRGDGEVYLSPVQGDELYCYIGIISFRPYGKHSQNIEPYFSAFEQIMRQYEGRPHWAKEFKLTKEQLQAMYPQWSEYQQVRQTLDPQGIFLNPWAEALFS